MDKKDKATIQRIAQHYSIAEIIKETSLLYMSWGDMDEVLEELIRIESSGRTKDILRIAIKAIKDLDSHLHFMPSGNIVGPAKIYYDE